MPGTSKSLTEFAKERPHRTSQCWMETLPPDVLEQCRAGWKAGLRHTVIVAWLKSLGYNEATGGRVAWLERDAASQ